VTSFATNAMFSPRYPEKAKEFISQMAMNAPSGKITSEGFTRTMVSLGLRTLKP
jgi:hypothetical protein